MASSHPGHHQKPAWLPEDFLSGPPLNASSSKIDFSKTVDAFPEYEGYYARIVNDLFTKGECDLLIRAAEESTVSDPSNSPKWEEALVNAGNGMQVLDIESRCCSRILWDCSWLADRLLSRIRPFVQGDIEFLRDVPHITSHGPAEHQEEIWRLARLNERLRFLRYYRGEYFHPHVDGCYVTPSGEEISYFTVHIYLNGCSSGRKVTDLCNFSPEQINSLPLRGGATTFSPPYIASDDARTFSVYPKSGTALIFQQNGLAHSGDEVLQGTKYTLRTDMMFRRNKTTESDVS
ncbi:hypothetical protein ACJ73_08666 [Blastomyces percursus]|uniref:Prolyl 4-hydroxylase alpha subunit domain-containing protein n=1 Tax=Blastomyces percursus TaxID=1658174 RepID=A0A1J9PS87_9EURO|nr:hypothetical protein ACJ73_08666 [Blastomyces percursus]